jgi:hypothetical protein
MEVTDWVGPIYRLADIYGRYQYRYRYIGIGKLDIGIGHIGIGICIGYIGIGQISVKIDGYRPKYRHISAEIIVICQISAKMKISVSVSVADMLVLIYLYRYRQKYWLSEYICIGIGWTHIGPTQVRQVIQVRLFMLGMQIRQVMQVTVMQFMQFMHLLQVLQVIKVMKAIQIKQIIQVMQLNKSTRSLDRSNNLVSSAYDTLVDLSSIVDFPRPSKINLNVKFAPLWNVMGSCLITQPLLLI